MPTHSVILYVDDPVKSAGFYEKLLNAKPLEASPGFAMFALTAPVTLGLWKRADVKPAVTAPAGGSEVGFKVESDDIVDKFFGAAKGVGASVLQEPTLMDFGYTFTVADPDGNRLRVYSPS